MKILRKGKAVLLGTILREVLERADALHEGKAALFVVSLQDARGLALAVAMHKVSPIGPDPAVLRDQLDAMGAVEPLMAGSVAVETLASLMESLGGAEPPDRHLLGWTVREIHASGGVPVVMLADGMVLVTTLETVAQGGDDLELRVWSRPVVGKA